MEMDKLIVNCQKCKYYYITWDKAFPYGCRLFGVKSKQQPSIIVYKSLGYECPNFEQKDWMYNWRFQSNEKSLYKNNTNS